MLVAISSSLCACGGAGPSEAETGTSEAGESETETETGGEDPAPPNVILIFADDLGYADLGVYGAPHIQTPHLDGLAATGARFTSFYAGNAVCTPSRAVLLSGRLGPRQILAGTIGGVYWPFSTTGMDPGQITIAELLHEAGYATALIGKWHLGHEPAYDPLAQGFDRFYGPTPTTWIRCR